MEWTPGGAISFPQARNEDDFASHGCAVKPFRMIDAAIGIPGPMLAVTSLIVNGYRLAGSKCGARPPCRAAHELRWPGPCRGGSSGIYDVSLS